MRHISDGHEFRPRGGLLLVTTIHFYLYRYFPGAIDRARMHETESENRHAAKSHLRRPASGPLARLKSFHRGWWSPFRNQFQIAVRPHPDAAGSGARRGQSTSGGGAEKHRSVLASALAGCECRQESAPHGLKIMSARRLCRHRTP